jgi:nucleoside-diphosphate-sugar epimerase
MAHKIFLTGATGYIGGSILNKLLQHPDKYSVTALVRDDKKAQELARLGVTTIDGDLNHQEALFMASEEADAVINAADADHLGAAKSIVKGLKAKNNKAAVFLHTSGTGVLCSEGATDTPFDDEDIAKIRKIPINAPHKEVDEWIFNNCDDITFSIIAPSIIYGLGRGPCKKLSVAIPALARAAVKRKKAGWVGSKETRWGNVHIDDLVDLYILVLDGLLAGKIAQGKEGGWYFGSHGEHNWGQKIRL